MKFPENYFSRVKEVLRNYTNLSDEGADQVAETMEDLFKNGGVIDRHISRELRVYFYALQEHSLLKAERMYDEDSEWRDFLWRPRT